MKKLFRQFYDNETDAFWVVFKSGAETRYEEIAPGFNVEFNERSEVIGIEIQGFSRLFNYKSENKNAEETKNNYIFPKVLGTKSVLYNIFKTDSFN